MQEAFDDVIVAHGQGEKSAKPDDETAERENHVVQMVLEASTPETKTNWEEDGW